MAYSSPHHPRFNGQTEIVQRPGDHVKCVYLAGQEGLGGLITPSIARLQQCAARVDGAFPLSAADGISTFSDTSERAADLSVFGSYKEGVTDYL